MNFNLNRPSQVSSLDVLDFQTNFATYDTQKKVNRLLRIDLHVYRNLFKTYGVHSINAMKAAGFEYTGIGDTARCNSCDLEISDWNIDIKPFIIHSSNSPECPFVCSIRLELKIGETHLPWSSPISTQNKRDLLLLDSRKSCEHLQSNDTDTNTSTRRIFEEVEITKRIRIRSFSHWPKYSTPTKAQLVESGFFSCNVGDRVICLYCDLICQQWIPQTDDPYEVHKTLSPRCPYILSLASYQSVNPPLILNENLRENSQTSMSSLDSVRSTEVVIAAACNPAYTEIPKRQATYETWPNKPLPSVDDLVRAGLFYTGVETIVTCFYCNGSLQNWGANDNPMVEHARWYPHCAYARQLCGDDLYRCIQESKSSYY